MTRDGVDELDRAVIHALQIDGRAPFRRISEVLGVSDQTVARRFSRLSGALGLRVVALTDPAVLRERHWVLRVRAAPEAASEVAKPWPGVPTPAGSPCVRVGWRSSRRPAVTVSSHCSSRRCRVPVTSLMCGRTRYCTSAMAVPVSRSPSGGP
ncbi:Lrp/AsnC family transcriptional regulator [Streptomyces malaysiensis]|uniref:Lrp/AsnC family transcriptional regulator n=1 Tax=Streptomyces malaysiensis TaxID=92644 RepID=UPI0020C7434E|nr:AsnC family protein [Streptomyces samsunensis]